MTKSFVNLYTGQKQPNTESPLMKLKLITATLIAASSLSFAHEGATGVVAKRMDAMSIIGDNNRTLSSIARGRAEFDLDAVIKAANAIAEQAGQSFIDYFPEGSVDAISDAKPEIWQEWDKFSQISFDLETAANNLSSIESEAEFATAYKAVSATCGSCHRPYRK